MPPISRRPLRTGRRQSSHQRDARDQAASNRSETAQVSLIVGPNDDMAFGARRAFEELSDAQERGRWLRLPFTGCDGVARSGQEWVRQGRLAATVISPRP